MKHHKKQNQQCSTDEHNPDPKKIEHRAYELYLDRGSDPGHDCEDWLRAERELKTSGETARDKILM